MKTQDVNILYNILKDVEFIESVLKSYNMDLENIEKVKQQINNKLKEPS